MYSNRYNELFYEKMNYNWQQNSSISWIKWQAKGTKIILFWMGVLMIGVTVYVAFSHHAPLIIFFSTILILFFYSFCIKGRDSTTSSEYFARTTYQQFVINKVHENSSYLTVENKTKYWNLILEENKQALQNREKQYSTYFVTLLGVIAPFSVYAFNLISKNNAVRNYIFNWLITPNFFSALVTLFAMLFIAIGIFESGNHEYYMLLNISNSYWKHKIIRKAVLDEKYSILYGLRDSTTINLDIENNGNDLI